MSTSCSSGLDVGRSDTVVQVNHAAPEAALVQELELGMGVGRQCTLAGTHENRPEEEMALIHQALRERLAGELGPADRDVGRRALLQPPDRIRIELPLDAGFCAGDRLKGPGVDDLL